LRIGILASHEGTTLQAIIDACATGAIPGQVVAVISNNRDSGALQRARAAGIATHHLSSQTHGEPAALDAAICGTLVEHRVEIVVLAGYMKKLGAQTLADFKDRVVNTHPALLPKFGGKDMYGLTFIGPCWRPGRRRVARRCIWSMGNTTPGPSSPSAKYLLPRVICRQR
jgi:phosphoribosylglycinamide formyltransferase 1